MFELTRKEILGISQNVISLRGNTRTKRRDTSMASGRSTRGRRVKRVPETPVDRRLLGTWRSDKRQTFKEWLWRPGTPAGRKRKLKNLFGKLKVRFTRQRIQMTLPGWKYVGPYEVLGSDSDSVAIQYWDTLLEIPRIHHLHFVKRWYWVTFGNGRYREWFKRVD